MNAVNFRTADLNLFRVFVTLLEEKNATRAGERLGLSQSAVSHALRRLREMVGDELFIRGQTGLRPTPRALEIADTARTALKLLETAVTAQRFDPAVRAERDVDRERAAAALRAGLAVQRKGRVGGIIGQRNRKAEQLGRVELVRVGHQFAARAAASSSSIRAWRASISWTISSDAALMKG